jgi:glycosyltransferase 2 family protein
VSRLRLANLVGVAIGVAGIGFVVRQIVLNRAEIGAALSAATLGWLAVGGATGILATGLLGTNWLSVIRRAGGRVSWRRGMSWFYVGQLGKYVPGGIWPVVGQAELAHRGATPRAAAYTSTAIAMVAAFLGAAMVAAVSGLVSSPDGRLLPIVIVGTLAVLFAALVVPSTRSMVHRIAARSSGRQLLLPEPRWFATLVVRHMPVWIAYSGMNVFAVAALGGDLDTSLVIELVYVTCISWMAGFVAVGVPGGIGVRETVFISMMSSPLGAGVAVSAAVLSRLLAIAVDLTGAACSVGLARTAAVHMADAAEVDRSDECTVDRYASP